MPPNDQLSLFEGALRQHLCHADGCAVAVPPRMLMCKKHWIMVPKRLQNEVWRTYRPGQEVTKDPSRDYLVAMRAAIVSVAQQEGRVRR